jgi:hypothetical protein
MKKNNLKNPLSRKNGYKEIKWEGKNKEILESIDRYCFDENYRDYALMIDGAWGSGKTFLIADYFKRRWTEQERTDVSIKPLHVSLYGITSSSEISDALFAALHPVISSKAGRITGAVIKGILKKGLSVEWSDVSDGEKEKIDVKGLDLSNVDIGPDGTPTRRVVVFDDFERAKLSPSEILAAIHPLIESNQNRVIIISNEKEINNRESSDEKDKYFRSKEKTIGFTLSINPDFDSVYDDIKSLFANNDYVSFLLDSKDEIREIATSDYGRNFRVLRQAMTAFEDLFTALDTKFQKQEYYSPIRRVFKVIYVGFIETRQRGTDISFFRCCCKGGLKIKYSSQTEAKEEDKKSEFLERISKQFGDDGIDIDRVGLSYEIFESLVAHSSINKELLNSNLISHPAFREADKVPSWWKIWYYETRPSTAAAAVNDFLTDFSSRNFKDLEALHACSIYLMLSRKGAINIKLPEAVNEAKKYIEENFTKRKDAQQEENLPVFVEDVTKYSGPFGLSFKGGDEVEFKEILDYYNEYQRKWSEKNFSDKINSILDMAKNNTENFFRIMEGTATEIGMYKHSPVLHFIDAVEFSKCVFDKVVEDDFRICLLLNMRFFDGIHLDPRHKQEDNWFRCVRKNIIKLLEESNFSTFRASQIRVLLIHYLGDSGDDTSPDNLDEPKV